jgi:hypothetical protein
LTNLEPIDGLVPMTVTPEEARALVATWGPNERRVVWQHTALLLAVLFYPISPRVMRLNVLTDDEEAARRLVEQGLCEEIEPRSQVRAPWASWADLLPTMRLRLVVLALLTGETWSTDTLGNEGWLDVLGHLVERDTKGPGAHIRVLEHHFAEAAREWRATERERRAADRARREGEAW